MSAKKKRKKSKGNKIETSEEQQNQFHGCYVCGDFTNDCEFFKPGSIHVQNAPLWNQTTVKTGHAVLVCARCRNLR